MCVAPTPSRRALSHSRVAQARAARCVSEGGVRRHAAGFRTHTSDTKWHFLAPAVRLRADPTWVSIVPRSRRALPSCLLLVLSCVCPRATPLTPGAAEHPGCFVCRQVTGSVPGRYVNPSVGKQAERHASVCRTATADYFSRIPHRALWYPDKAHRDAVMQE